jgi:hypothetical protein
MRAEKFKRIMAKVIFHASVLFRGLCKAVYGAAITGLIVFSVCGFVAVSSETGWTAVCDFVASCALLVIALGGMYLIGCRKRGAKHG